MRKNKYLLITILIIAALLRFWRLDSYPALNADEAAIGYNAYSLIQTGQDEHGNAWPIHFQSFNDYKPGGYFYLALPFVKFLGLNEWAVRIPGAFFGALTVLAVYLLVKELFKDSEEFSIFNFQFSIAEISALFLAISPWHIHFSRGGWEVSVATFFMTLGLWLFIKSLNNPKYYILSGISFSLSLYTYHAARVVIPLLVLGSIVIYRKKIIRNLKNAALGAVVAFIVLLPLGMDFTRGNVFSRAAGVGLFADQGPLARINEQRGQHADFKGVAAKLLHNKPVNYGLAFLENWSEHYWGEFLFLSGDDIERNKVPETGQMYLFDLIFVLIGLAAIIKKPKNRKILIWWLVIAPAAAALTFQSPHALRAQNMVIPLVIISAIGFLTLFECAKKVLKKRQVLLAFNLLLIAFMFWQFARYQHMYWVHMDKEYPFSSQYGVREVVSYLEKESDNYDKVIVTDRYDQPYILFLFYQKYPPADFQKEHTLTAPDEYGFSTVRRFGKYEFASIDYDQMQPNNPNSILVGTDAEIPDEANIVKEIYGSNDYKYFDIVAN